MNRFNYFACSQTQACNYFDFSFMKVYLLNCECSYVLDLLLCLFEGLMHCLHEGSIYTFSEHSCL